MPIDLTHSTLLTLAEAARLLPGRPHFSKLIRWGQRGVGGVRLDLVKVGGRWHVSKQALERFIATVTATADSSRCSNVPDADELDRTADEAGRKLDALVFGRTTGRKHLKQQST